MQLSNSWLVGLFVSAVLAAGSAYGATEKGPRCSDGIDNDLDGFIDSADSDCGGNVPPPTSESVEWSIPESLHSDVAASVSG